MQIYTNKKMMYTAIIGNLFEHYDTALLGLLFPFIAPVFFPSDDSLTSLIKAYALFPLSIIAKPLGSLFFGKLGDQIGKGQVVSITLFAMGMISCIMVFLPSYASIGLLAPLILWGCKLAQNFFAAGELIGGGLYVMENSPTQKRDLLSSFYCCSTMLGIILASSAISTLCYFDLITYWRSLYLLGTGIAFIGVILRKNLRKVPFIPPQETSLSRFKILWTYRKAFLQIFFIAGFAYSNYSISVLLLSSLIPQITEFTAGHMSYINTSLLVIDLIALPVFGFLSQKFSKEKVMLIASSLIAVLSFPLFAVLPFLSLLGIVFVRIFFVLLGVAFTASFYSFCLEIAPEKHRFLIISLAYSSGSQILGSPTVSLSLWIYQLTKSTFACAIYWSILALIATQIVYRLTVKKEVFV